MIVLWKDCPLDQASDVAGMLNPVPCPPMLQEPDVPGCCSGMAGLTMDGTGLFGSGLFAGGMDVSTWGWGEGVTIAAALYVLYAVQSTTKAEFRRASRGYKRMRRRKPPEA